MKPKKRPYYDYFPGEYADDKLEDANDELFKYWEV